MGSHGAGALKNLVLGFIVLAATETIGRWGYIGVVPLLTGMIGICLL